MGNEKEIIADLLKAFEILHPREGTWKTPTSLQEYKITKAIEEAELYLNS